MQMLQSGPLQDTQSNPMQPIQSIPMQMSQSSPALHPPQDVLRPLGTQSLPLHLPSPLSDPLVGSSSFSPGSQRPSTFAQGVGYGVVVGRGGRPETNMILGIAEGMDVGGGFGSPWRLCESLSQ